MSKRHGPLLTPVRKQKDGRYGFEDYFSTGKRIQVRRQTKAAADQAHIKLSNLIATGRKDLAQTNHSEWAEFRAWKASHESSVTVADAIQTLLATKKEEGDVGQKWLNKLEDYLSLFSGKFSDRSLVKVREPEIDEWLRGLELKPHNRNNIRAAVVQLYRWARSKRFLPDEITEAERVKKLKIKKAVSITLWTAEQMKKRMSVCPIEHIPLQAINGFSGVRAEELKPEYNDKTALAWEDFDWNARMIRMSAETSKVNEARDIPISDQLEAWLRPFRDCTGPCVTFALSVSQVSELIAQLSGVPHKRNANRHTFISCWMAKHRDLSTIADICGTSAGLIKKNYRRPIPLAEAEAYLSLMPSANSSKVVQFQTQMHYQPKTRKAQK